MKLPGILPAVLLATISAVSAAPVFQADPNAEGVTTDLWDFALGAQVIFSTPQHNGAGNSDPRSAFGFTSGFVEGTHALFADGPGAGTVDFIEWQTPQAINLSGISLHLQDDGSSNRSALAFKLFASQDGVNFSQVSSGSVPNAGNGYLNNPLLITDGALTGPVSAVRAFRVEITRASGAATRIMEIDATGTAAASAVPFLDRLAFNDATNSLTGRGGAGKDDEGAGLGSGYTFSSAVLGGVDTVRDAFGGNHGAVEPESFIFGDGGAVNNGNLVLGDSGETVDFIQWHTAQPISLAGFRLALSGDGASPNRDTALVRFFIEGVAVDLFDNNGFDGDVSRLFAGGTVIGDDFRIEFTRTTSSGGRLFEIDAFTSVATGWLGTAGNNNWSSVGNWAGTGPAAGERNLFLGRNYQAAGAVGAVTAHNDLVAYVGNRLAFQDSDAAGTGVDGALSNDTAFIVTGNGFTLSALGGSVPRIENNSFVTQTFNLDSGQTLTLNGGAAGKAEINPTNGDLVFSPTTRIDLAGTTQLQIAGDNGRTVTFHGVISSSGNGGANGVAIIQNSHVVFAASNTYTGATTINAGSLTLSGAGALADSSAVNVAGSSTIFDISAIAAAGETIGSLAGVGGSAVVLGSRNLTAGGDHTGTVFAGVLSGTDGSFTKTGNGILTLTGANTYTGLTTISGGTVKFEIPIFYNGFVSDIVNNAAVEFNMSGFFNRNITGTGTISRNTGEFILGGGTTADTQSWVLTGGRTFYNTQANLGSGAIAVSSGGKLIKNAGGDLALANAVTLTDGGGLNNRYDGTLTINKVTLPGTGLVVFNLDDQPTSTLSLNGPALALSGTGLTVAVGGANATVGGVILNHAIGGAGTLTKTGPGTLTLAGAQTYDTLNADDGVTNLNSALGTGASTLNAHATVNIHASQTLAALNIADGVEVTFGDGLSAFAAPGKSGVAAVPEPGSMALLLLGGAMLARRRTK